MNDIMFSSWVTKQAAHRYRSTIRNTNRSDSGKLSIVYDNVYIYWFAP